MNQQQEQPGVQIDISKADTIQCEDCGNASFIQAFREIRLETAFK